MGPKIWINGELYEKADARISVYDHGLLYGDGVFEGLRVYAGKVFRLPIPVRVPLVRGSAYQPEGE